MRNNIGLSTRSVVQKSINDEENKFSNVDDDDGFNSKNHWEKTVETLILNHRQISRLDLSLE